MFDHERLHVYQASLQFVAWVFERAEGLKGLFRHSRDELIRASQSIPRNIAEGNGKRALTDLMLKSAAMVKNPITITSTRTSTNKSAWVCNILVILKIKWQK